MVGPHLETCRGHDQRRRAFPEHRRAHRIREKTAITPRSGLID